MTRGEWRQRILDFRFWILGRTAREKPRNRLRQQPVRQLPPTTYYLPPTTYHILPTTYHLPPTTCSSPASSAPLRWAFMKLLERIKAQDPNHQVVLMVQVENEMPSHRDYGPVAQEVWRKPVPQGLFEHLIRHEAELSPWLRQVWMRNGRKTSGTWAEVFGEKDNEGGRVFGTWSFGRFAERDHGCSLLLSIDPRLQTVRAPVQRSSDGRRSAPWQSESRTWHQHFVVNEWPPACPEYR